MELLDIVSKVVIVFLELGIVRFQDSNLFNSSCKIIFKLSIEIYKLLEGNLVLLKLSQRSSKVGLQLAILSLEFFKLALHFLNSFILGFHFSFKISYQLGLLSNELGLISDLDVSILEILFESGHHLLELLYLQGALLKKVIELCDFYIGLI